MASRCKINVEYGWSDKCVRPLVTYDSLNWAGIVKLTMKKPWSRKKLFLLLVLVLTVISVSLPVYFLYQISGDYPLVAAERKSVNPETARSTKKLAKRLLISVFSKKSTESFTVNEDELNHLLSLVSRSFKRLRAQVNVTNAGTYIALSLYLPENPFGDFINVSFMVLPSRGGLDLYNVRLGDLSMEGATAKYLAAMVLDVAMGNKLGSRMISSVESVDISNDTLEILFHPIPDLEQKLESFKERIRYVRKELNLGGDPVQVRYYFRKLCHLDQSMNLDVNKSLAEYIPFLFQLARERVSDGNGAKNEYRAAILAMSIYFGSNRFEAIIGKVKTPDLKHCMGDKKTVLAGRRDLMLHFIISAGLKVLSDNGVPFVIGEFKELLDTGKWGSGFSFVDLAADRAGLKFAELAVNKQDVDKLAMLSDENLTEKIFFPEIDGLPEGLSKTEFDYYYKNVDSIYYKSMLKDIDKRIGVLQLYR